MAWDAAIPANDALLTNFPANCRANWDALELLTDTDLQITNAKVHASAAIADTKLAQITTAAKVSGAAITLLTSVPSGAGVLPDANSPHKLKADASDTTPQYLDSLINTDMFEVSAGDLLELKDGGVETEKLESGSASPGNSKYYGTNVSGTKGFFSLPSDHGALSGLGDDDHSQYLNTTRHDADDHSGLSVSESMLANSSISQAKLKTSTGEVSEAGANTATGTMAAHLWGLPVDTSGNGSGVRYSLYPPSPGTSYVTKIHLAVWGDPAGGNPYTMSADEQTLPGGEYGFYPQIKSPTTGTPTAYAQQRYVTASGKDHWIFLKINKTTGKIKSAYSAPDHPCYGNGDDPEELPHPFGNVSEDEEVILIDNEVLNEAKEKVTSKRSLLTVINEDYEIDTDSKPTYKPREHIFIDEWGDKDGEVIKTINTPQWAKIAIQKDKIQLKKKVIDKLPGNVKFKKLKKKGVR